MHVVLIALLSNLAGFLTGILCMLLARKGGAS